MSIQSNGRGLEDALSGEDRTSKVTKREIAIQDANCFCFLLSEFRGTLGLATNTGFKVLVNLAISEVNEFRKIKTMIFQKIDLALQDDPSENRKTI
ncbi:hypothetical protein MKW98_002514 [Papaver atlanticum]|uniref:Uncharacterized protein n=1 Tax=Papaver atlanticum TaxID=357466 RepID=A0AAD4XAI6_9MAGN|nr:hypothetical protein MKW98_002514 [Papaver atlanticum]